MTTRTLRVAMATAFLMMGAASLQAEPTGPAGDAIEVRVVNNHTSAVHVYVQDIFGRLHSLGWVNRSDAKVLTVPGKMTELGAVQIEIFPDQPVWSPTACARCR